MNMRRGGGPACGARPPGWSVFLSFTHTIGRSVNDDGPGVVEHAIENGGGHSDIAIKDVGPFLEGFIGDDGGRHSPRMAGVGKSSPEAAAPMVSILVSMPRRFLPSRSTATLVPTRTTGASPSI